MSKFYIAEALRPARHTETREVKRARYNAIRDALTKASLRPTVRFPYTDAGQEAAARYVELQKVALEPHGYGDQPFVTEGFTL